MYEPRPIDVTEIAMPEELGELIEMLACNNHDIWAEERIRQGWTFGAERNDAEKLHPDLIPYEELPESEKEFDRKTAIGVLKVVLAAGYRIEKLG